MSKTGLIVMAAVALLQSEVDDAEAARSVVCRVPRAPRGVKWKLKSVEIETDSSLWCHEVVSATRRTLWAQRPSRRVAKRLAPTEFHVWVEDISTQGEIRFEARAWAVGSRGQLRHASKAVAAVKRPRGPRDPTAKRVARSALNRALSELASEARRPHVAAERRARPKLAVR
jgi:hypothetical protein